MQASDIAVGGIGGAIAGWAGAQVKDNDAAKVQAETERRETLLLEKEKRQNEVEDFKELRKRGWQTEDATRKRGEELTDADTNMTFDASQKATERQFKTGETDKTLASHEKIAGMQLEASINREKGTEGRMIDRESRAESRQFSKDQKAAVSDLRKEYLKAKNDDPVMTTTFENWSQQNLPELYEIAYPDKVGTQETAADSNDHFNTIFNKIRPNQRATNPGETTGTVIQPGTVRVEGDTVIANNRLPNKAYGNRPDGSPKGNGFMGEIPTADGGVMTENTIDINIDGKKVYIPSVVPTLTKEEIKYLSNGGKPTKAIVDKAVKYYLERKRSGKGAYAEDGDLPLTMKSH